MPPPSPIFEKMMDENQVSYFIWPNFMVRQIHLYSQKVIEKATCTATNNPTCKFIYLLPTRKS